MMSRLPEDEEGTLNFKVKLPLESEVTVLIRIIVPSESFISIPIGFPAMPLSTLPLISTISPASNVLLSISMEIIDAADTIEMLDTNNKTKKLAINFIRLFPQL